MDTWATMPTISGEGDETKLSFATECEKSSKWTYPPGQLHDDDHPRPKIERPKQTSCWSGPCGWLCMAGSRNTQRPKSAAKPPGVKTDPAELDTMAKELLGRKGQATNNVYFDEQDQQNEQEQQNANPRGWTQNANDLSAPNDEKAHVQEHEPNNERGEQQPAVALKMDSEQTAPQGSTQDKQIQCRKIGHRLNFGSPAPLAQTEASGSQVRQDGGSNPTQTAGMGQQAENSEHCGANSSPSAPGPLDAENHDGTENSRRHQSDTKHEAPDTEDQNQGDEQYGGPANPNGPEVQTEPNGQEKKSQPQEIPSEALPKTEENNEENNQTQQRAEKKDEPLTEDNGQKSKTSEENDEEQSPESQVPNEEPKQEDETPAETSEKNDSPGAEIETERTGPPPAESTESQSKDQGKLDGDQHQPDLAENNLAYYKKPDCPDKQWPSHEKQIQLHPGNQPAENLVDTTSGEQFDWDAPTKGDSWPYRKNYQDDRNIGNNDWAKNKNRNTSAIQCSQQWEEDVQHWWTHADAVQRNVQDCFDLWENIKGALLSPSDTGGGRKSSRDQWNDQLCWKPEHEAQAGEESGGASSWDVWSETGNSGGTWVPKSPKPPEGQTPIQDVTADPTASTATEPWQEGGDQWSKMADQHKGNKKTQKLRKRLPDEKWLSIHDGYNHFKDESIFGTDIWNLARHQCRQYYANRGVTKIGASTFEEEDQIIRDFHLETWPGASEPDLSPIAKLSPTYNPWRDAKKGEWLMPITPGGYKVYDWRPMWMQGIGGYGYLPKQLLHAPKEKLDFHTRVRLHMALLDDCPQLRTAVCEKPSTTINKKQSYYASLWWPTWFRNIGYYQWNMEPPGRLYA